jgi:hypothetical protein
VGGHHLRLRTVLYQAAVRTAPASAASEGAAQTRLNDSECPVHGADDPEDPRRLPLVSCISYQFADHPFGNG